MDAMKRVLLACMPKSGSTYLRGLLSRLPHFQVTHWVPGYDRREQELCPLRLQEDCTNMHTCHLIAQHHVRYSDVTKRYIDTFNLKPIVLVRKIYDVIPSLIDHHHLESTVYPMAYTPSDILNWEHERAVSFVTQMVIPWYFNFFVSWNDCPNKLLVSFDELIKSPHDTVERICKSIELTCSYDDIHNAIKNAVVTNTRKNVGISGRGDNLPSEYRNMVKTMASFYPDVDFSLLGL